MKLRAVSRIAQLFGVSVVDQIVLSGANFLIGFLLIRRTSDTDYGLFVLVQSGIALLISAQGAWLSGPLTVVALRKSAERRREMLGAAKESQDRFLRRVAPILMIIPAAMYWLLGRSFLVCVVSALGILAGWTALQREYLRTSLLMYRRSHDVLRADLCYVAVLVTGACIAAYGPKPAAIYAVSALAAAGLAGSRVAFRQLAKDPGWVSADAAPVWSEIRSIGVWSAIGAVIYWLFTQSYSYVLASRLDLSAVTAVNAARLLLMPTIVLTVGVTSMLMPTAASWLAEFGFNKLMRRLLAFLVVIALLDASYFAFVWFLRDWLTNDLLHKAIADRDRLLVLWAGVALVGLVRDFLQCAMFALGRQKSMAWLIGLSAIIALTVMWFGLGRWGAAAVLIGQIVGECVNLAGLIALLHRQFRLYSAR
jgi:O-antigen/teichoic acid export membrane protein